MVEETPVVVEVHAALVAVLHDDERCNAHSISGDRLSDIVRVKYFSGGYRSCAYSMYVVRTVKIIGVVSKISVGI